MPAGEAGKALTEDEAAAAVARIYAELVETSRTERSAELEEKSIHQNGKTLKWLEKTFGDAPDGQRSLWISMHGGGGAPEAVNDRQWRNQIGLYQPAEGIYVAPRAPTDTWNLWHQAHIDPLFDRLIENMVALRGVDPDRVYLLGYSAGGDGVWQLAPRMADRFAAAAMMAGHPNDASLRGLRNLPFGIFMGGADSAYDRNRVAAEKTAELAALREGDPRGYEHWSRIYPDTPHWMNGKDAEALPWMAKFTRRTWPRKVVWVQDDVTHEQFYWLQVPAGQTEPGWQIEAEVDGQTIVVRGEDVGGLRLRLHDDLIDLDEPISMRVNDGDARVVRATRREAAIRAALEDRLDPAITPTAVIELGDGDH